MCDFGVRVAPLTSCSFYGRSIVAVCTPVEDVEQLLARPWELVYQ